MSDEALQSCQRGLSNNQNSLIPCWNTMINVRVGSRVEQRHLQLPLIDIYLSL